MARAESEPVHRASNHLTGSVVDDLAEEAVGKVGIRLHLGDDFVSPFKHFGTFRVVWKLAARAVPNYPGAETEKCKRQ